MTSTGKNGHVVVQQHQKAAPRNPLDGLRDGTRQISTSLWETAPTSIARLVQTAVGSGALISFGMTNDGGALCVFVKMDERKVRLYASSCDEFEQLCDVITDRFE
jgi:hypothetical protein